MYNKKQYNKRTNSTFVTCIIVHEALWTGDCIWCGDRTGWRAGPGRSVPRQLRAGSCRATNYSIMNCNRLVFYLGSGRSVPISTRLVFWRVK